MAVTYDPDGNDESFIPKLINTSTGTTGHTDAIQIDMSGSGSSVSMTGNKIIMNQSLDLKVNPNPGKPEEWAAWIKQQNMSPAQYLRHSWSSDGMTLYFDHICLEYGADPDAEPETVYKRTELPFNQEGGWSYKRYLGGTWQITPAIVCPTCDLRGFITSAGWDSTVLGA